MVATLPLFFILLLGGTNANELLDLIDTKAYWTLRGEITDAELVTELGKAAPEPQPGMPPKMASIRKLMVIRTLGEHKHKGAADALGKLAESKEPFVAAYAKRSLAQIQGKAYKPDGPSDKDLAADLALMPDTSGAVGQLRLPAGGPVDMRQFAKVMPGGDAEQQVTQITNQVLNFAEQTGNIRLDAITFGMKFFQGDTGYVAAVGRGQFDAANSKAQLANTEMQPIDVNGTAVYKGDDNMAFMIPSDERAVITVGENAQILPVEALTSAMKKADGKITFKGAANDLLANVDRTKRFWFVGEVPDPMRHKPVTRAFSNFTIEADLKDNKLAVKVVGLGDDAAAVAEAAATFKTELADMIADAENKKGQLLAQQQQMAADPQAAQHAGRLDAMIKSIDASIKAMKSIKVEKGEKSATVTGEVDLSPDGGAMNLMGMGAIF